MFKGLCNPIFGIISFSVLFAIPWTIIPRTNSIVYQKYWIEILLPCTTVHMLIAGVEYLNLATWANEKALLSKWNYFKIYLMSLAPYAFVYICIYLIWSVYLDFNHPMPYLAFIILPSSIILAIGLWCILPAHLLDKKDFRHKLKTYMYYLLWIWMTHFKKEKSN